MFDKIRERLLGNGYIPDLIIDVGAHKGNWTKEMLKIYPFSKYFLFEATEYRELEFVKHYPNVVVYNTVLNNENKIVDWYQINDTGDSMYKELTMFYKNVEPIKKESKTLNSFFDNGIDYSNIVLKIDCQGAEIPILEGATLLYEKCDFIIMEIPFFGQYNENVATFAEHIAFMDKIGFVVYEFLESHIINNFNIQVDMIFIRKGHPFFKRAQESFMIKYQEHS